MIVDNLSNREMAIAQNLPYLPPILSLLPSGHIEHETKDSLVSKLEAQFTSNRLPIIDQWSLFLYNALSQFRPVREDYAVAPYASSFNFKEMQLPSRVEREWYIVAFRSKRKKGSDSGSLYQADRDAHEEAVKQGGLLMYWYGTPDSEGHNIATCIWQSRAHAIAANSGPKHRIAINQARNMFEHFRLERYVLRKVKGETGLHIEQLQA